jgi:hypothetical protein
LPPKLEYANKMRLDAIGALQRCVSLRNFIV